MDLEKFTDRAKGFLQSAQTVAIRMNHQRIAPEHLLKALLEDSEGMASGLIAKAGGDAKIALRDTDAALAKIPQVSGGGAQQTPQLDNDLVRLLDTAEQVAKKAGDSYVTVERLLLACALSITTTAGKALAAAGVTPEAINAAIVELRGGRTADTRLAPRPLRRAEEIRARPDRGGARRKARSGDRPRRGNPPHHPDPGEAHQEQPGADRRSRRRQDRDRRRAGAAHRQWRRARHAARPQADGARHGQR